MKQSSFSIRVYEIFFSFILLAYLGCITHSNRKIKNKSKASIDNPSEHFYDFVVSDIKADDFFFASLKGKKVMIVNTASRCGLTPQYKALEELYRNHKDQGFIVIGFPANNFMGQEPGSNDEISAFCHSNYGVTFPMMAKISVKGESQHPVYQFLTSKLKNGVRDSEVSWNFQKYLIDETGVLDRVISPKTPPLSKEIIDWINSKHK